MVFVRVGKLELTVDDRVFSLEKGDTAFLSDGVLHGGAPTGNDCVYDCVVFSGELIGKNVSRGDVKTGFGNTKNIRTFLPRGEYPDICRCAERLCDVLNGTVSEADEMIATGILLEFFGEILKNEALEDGAPVTNKHITRLKNVISYIDGHYSEKITLTELSEAVGVSPKYLCRTFMSLTGKTPISYINEYRVECACEMLRSGDESMPEIAIACGFGDQSYFVKQFHRTVGMTPGAYRKGNTKKEV